MYLFPPWTTQTRVEWCPFFVLMSSSELQNLNNNFELIRGFNRLRDLLDWSRLFLFLSTFFSLSTSMKFNNVLGEFAIQNFLASEIQNLNVNFSPNFNLTFRNCPLDMNWTIHWTLSQLDPLMDTTSIDNNRDMIKIAKFLNWSFWSFWSFFDLKKVVRFGLLANHFEWQIVTLHSRNSLQFENSVRIWP